MKPGALTNLLRQVAATPGEREAEPPPLLPGAVIGRFEILRELGRGAFGVVYEARDQDLGRQVALKMVRPGAAAAEDGKVSREAEAIARLAHPNLITLYDVGRCDSGPYLVFELLRGKTLQERIDDGPIPVQEAVHIALEVARGLAHAHAEGVVHRDLKPSNVFVTNKGQVKILDFGMAHAFGRRRLSGGTPAYMAPEQWEDAPEDERTDVFALGVMLYRMLSGEYPFPEGSGRWAAEATRLRKLDVPGAPELADMVQKMLDRSPTARPRDGAVVLAELTPIEDALRTRPADGPPPLHATRRRATLGDLLAELKRRHVFRVMIGYGIFAFAVLQVTEPVLHAYDLPAWVLTAVVTAVAVGFPLSVILAWIFDLTVEGVKRTPTGTRPGGRSIPRASLAAWLLGVALIAAIPVGGWYAWKRASERGSGATAPALTPSIAVLPFIDLSPGKDPDYFADGIAEEILGALTRVPGLRVPGRSSSFWFKGKNVEPAEIARKLSVTHLLEGSVRRSGSKLRITAEVVRASTGDRVWSENYERELTDVFAIQDEIARSVVRALAPMLLARTPPPPPTATTDPEAYRLFLLGRSLNAEGTTESTRQAVEALERAAAIDPRFAPSQAYLSIARGNLSLSEKGEDSRRLRKSGREAAERAVSLDSSSPWGYVARCWYRMRQDLDWEGASEDLDRAMAIDPVNESVLNVRALLLFTLGRTREAVELERRAVDLSPLNVVHTTNLAVFLLADGQLAEAREWARRSLEISPGSTRAFAVLAYEALLAGRTQEALASFGRSFEPGRSAGAAAALHSLGRGQESREAMVKLERDSADEPVYIAGARAWRGDSDGAFEALDRAVRERSPSVAGLKTFALLRPIRGDPRFTALLTRLNLPVEAGPTTMHPAEAVAAPSIAVLPFADMSEKHDQEYFADGVAEEILNALAQVQGLRVIGRTSSFSFKGKPDDLPAIGRKLGATTLLEGSVRKEGSRLRITAKLVQATDGAQVWSRKFDSDQMGVFVVQEEIAREVVGALKVKVLAGRIPTTKWMKTSNPEVYNQYLLGQGFRARGSLDSNRRALQAYEKALALDSEYAPAWAGLSAAIGNVAAMSDEPPAPKNRQRAAAAADRAVALAPDLAEGYHSRALIRSGSDPAGALTDEEKALSLNPNYAWAEAIRASLLSRLGRQTEALLAARRATELSPLDAWAWFYLGAVHTRGNDLDRGTEAFQRALEISPEHEPAQGWLVQNLLRKRRPGEALAVARRLRSEPTRLFFEALAQHDLGNAKESQAALDLLVAKKAGEDAYGIAQVHGWRGERNQAFEWLERAYVQGDPGLQEASEDPFLGRLHGDPRWKPFLRKMNLPVD